VVNTRSKKPPKRSECAKRRLVLLHEPDVKFLCNHDKFKPPKACVVGVDVRSCVSTESSKTPARYSLQKIIFKSTPSGDRQRRSHGFFFFLISRNIHHFDRSFVHGHCKTQVLPRSLRIAGDAYQRAIFSTIRDFQILLPHFGQTGIVAPNSTSISSRVKRIGLSGKPVNLSLSKFHEFICPERSKFRLSLSDCHLAVGQYFSTFISL
jgi:hypothetical protein